MEALTHRTCNHCGLEKPVSELVASKRYLGGYMPLCKPCRNDYWREKRNESPEAKRKHSDTVLRSKMLRQYGMVAEDYTLLVELQKDTCFLCGADHHGRNERYRYWNIDHSHATGRVRGLLCHTCNIAVGHFEKLCERVDVNEVLSYLQPERVCGIDIAFEERRSKPNGGALNANRPKADKG